MNPTNIIDNSTVYNADLSLIETVSLVQKDSENNDVEFRSNHILIQFLISIMILRINRLHLKCHLIGVKNKCLMYL